MSKCKAKNQKVGVYFLPRHKEFQSHQSNTMKTIKYQKTAISFQFYKKGYFDWIYFLQQTMLILFL